MWNQIPAFRDLFAQSSLETLAKYCSTVKDNVAMTEIEISLAAGFEEYDFLTKESKRFHEAGFDAYTTGYVYSKLYNSISKEEKEKFKNCVNVLKSDWYLKSGGSDIQEPFYDAEVIFAINTKVRKQFSMLRIRTKKLLLMKFKRPTRI